MPPSAQEHASAILSDTDPISIYHRWAQFGKAYSADMRFVLQVHRIVAKELDKALRTPEFKAYYDELLASYHK